MPNKYLLILIVIFGFLFRIVAVDKIPPSLNWDEVSHGYNAYSILKTGHDEWGMSFPLANFRAYGDYPLPLNLYITMPSILVFGLTEFGIRLPHVILGTLTIISVYYLCLALSKDSKISLLAALFAAVGPWYVFTSRFVLQSNLAVFFLTTSLALFLNRQKQKWFLPLSFLGFGLTLFSYHSTRIFTPLLVAALLVVYRKEFWVGIKRKKASTILSFAILLLFFIPLPFILNSPEARARSTSVFLLNEGAVNKIIENRNNSNLPEGLQRLVYNRPVYLIQEFAKNYIGYFSPQFLFLNGGTQYQFSVPNTGLLYLINLPFFYLGLFVVVKKTFRDKASYKFLLIWLILAPIPAAITTEKFAVLRSTTMLPLPEIFTAIGLVAMFYWIKKKNVNLIFISITYFLLLFLSIGIYLYQYSTSYTRDYSWAWQYGYRDAVEYAKRNYHEYDQIIMTKKYGEPHEFVLFYNSWDPEAYVNDPNLIRFNQSNWWWTDRFDKYNFVNDWQVKDLKLESGGEVDCENKKCLLITSPNNYPDGWTKLETINFLDNKAVFEIYDNRKI